MFWICVLVIIWCLVLGAWLLFIAFKHYYTQIPSKSPAILLHSTTTAVPLAATSIITIPL
jgi:hypothetical protein